MEALEFSYNNFNGFSQYQLANLTHDYPEWKEYQTLFKESKNSRKRYPIDVTKFFADPDIDDSPYIRKYLEGKDLFHIDDNELLKSNKKLFLDSITINNIWDQ